MKYVRHFAWVAAAYLTFVQLRFNHMLATGNPLDMFQRGSGIGFEVWPFISMERLRSDEIGAFFSLINYLCLALIGVLGLSLVYADAKTRQEKGNAPD